MPPDLPIRVMLVDDSAIIRSLIARILEPHSDIKIVGSFSNGDQAVKAAATLKPDIVILDVEMPVMDGLTALPGILQASPGSRVVMCSTLTVRNAEITLRALSLGATECIGKPTSIGEIQGGQSFRENLLRIIRMLGTIPKSVADSAPHPAPKISISTNQTDAAFIYRGRPSLVAIGCSTGGPQALLKVLPALKNIPVPVIITQHMPATFTAILAQHLTKTTSLTVIEGQEEMPLEPGKAYIAPGGYHMTLAKSGFDKTFIALNTSPPVNFCRPSVDPMLDSATNIYGNRTLGVILTGMGHDGLDSCRRLVDAGGRVVAQDEATSVVWGMPGAVASENLCTAVLPLGEIGPWIASQF